MEQKITYDGYRMLAEWAAGTLDSAINVMYFEFENTAPEDDPIIPILNSTWDQEQGTEYYSQLSAPKDYMRVPLQINPAAGYIDSNNVSGGADAIFMAMTNNTVGQNGVQFSAASNSKVYGVALVVATDPSDVNTDRVFARAYLDVSKVIPKSTDNQITFQWNQLFKDV